MCDTGQCQRADSLEIYFNLKKNHLRLKLSSENPDKTSVSRAFCTSRVVIA